MTLYKLEKKNELQSNLFENFDEKIILNTNRFEKISQTMDTINGRFGRDSVILGDSCLKK